MGSYGIGGEALSQADFSYRGILDKPSVFHMNKIRKLGFINYNGNLEVHKLFAERGIARRSVPSEGCGQAMTKLLQSGQY